MSNDAIQFLFFLAVCGLGWLSGWGARGRHEARERARRTVAHATRLVQPPAAYRVSDDAIRSAIRSAYTDGSSR